MAKPARTFGCSWEGLTEADLPELADLIAVIEYLDDTVHRHSLLDLELSLRMPGADPANNAILVRQKNGQLVAFGWNRVSEPHDPLRRAYLIGGCHPAWRNQGLGPTLFDWQVDRAQEWHTESYADGFSDLEMVAVADAKKPADGHLFEKAGFRAQRWFHDLHIEFEADRPPWQVQHVEGVRIVPFTDGLSECVRAAHNEIFADRPGAQRVSAADWAESMRAGAVRPHWSWVATAGDRVVGYAINSAFEAPDGVVGWTDRLGALPPWRNRNLLGALLATSLNSFRLAGLSGAGVGLDTDSGLGLRPYHELGYAELDTVIWYVRRGA